MLGNVNHNRLKLVAFIPLLAVVACWWGGLFAAIELRLEDSLYQHLSGASPQIFVIGIDEHTLVEYGPYETWSRAGVAMLIDKLMENPETAPKVIGVDIGFYGEKDPVGDQRLVDACARAGNVVLAGNAAIGTVVENDETGFSSAQRPILIEAPFDALAAVTTWGHTNINLDGDGVMRRALHSFTFEGKTIESFSAALYKAYTGEEAIVATDRNNEWRIPYSARPYAYYGVSGYGASLSKVVSGEYPVSAFKDAIVLVGAYAQGMQDSFDTPVSRDTRMYGVEIHANLLQALLENKRLEDAPAALTFALCAIMWIVGFFLLYKLPFRFSLPAVLALSAIYITLALWLSYRGWMLPIVGPVLAMLAMAAVDFGVQYTAMWRDKRRLIADFSRYLPREVAQHVASKGTQALKLGGVKRHICVLFVDIRGFTPLSERMPPEQLVLLLNRFLGLTTSCIFEQNGTVDKFIGDATMALFGAPEALEDYVYRAVAAALSMLDKSAELHNQLKEQGFEGIGFGIGINCGEAVVGNIGTEFRMEYTAIGDTVNTAARLESQAKPGEILISRDVYERVKDRMACTYLGERTLKGKSEPFPVWRADKLLDSTR